MEKFSLDDCSLAKVSSAEDLVAFRCGDEDLDDFFVHDAFLYSQQLLGKTYFFVSNDEKHRMYFDLIAYSEF